MFQKILVPTDLSECSKKALGVAVDLASTYGAQVFVLHVAAKPKTSQYDDTEGVKSGLKEIQADEGIIMDDVMAFSDKATKRGKRGITRENVFIRVASGGAAAETLKAIEDMGVDIVVMGTHGRSTIKDYFIGSTTERVAREASCAVLVVKPDGYPYLRD